MQKTDMAMHRLKLVAKRIDWEDVAVLDFIPTDGGKISFVPGQYLDLFAPAKKGEGVLGGRTYTIASLPEEQTIRFAIRRRGEISSALCDLTIGAEIAADGPHGNFCLPKETKSVVCLAGGIGVVPFVIWARAAKGSADKDNMTFRFLISNATEPRAAFLDELSNFADTDARVFVRSFLTRAAGRRDHPAVERRIGAQDIKDALGAASDDAVIAVCGSIGFVHDMRHAALALGVPEERILTEAFY